jgi:hypothetical protein
MSGERSRGRDRRQSHENLQYGDTREKALDALTNLYVQDKISLEQYENLAAEIQKAADPEAVLRSALIAHRMPAMEFNSNNKDFEDEQDRVSSGGHQRPLSPDPKNSFYPSFGQWGRSGDFFLCIMGERRVDGRLLSNKAASSVTLMGSTIIDLRGIQLPASGLRLELVAVMGEIKILVSPGTPVHFSVVPIMGEAVSRADVPANASLEGVLEISGVALMGSVSVRVSSLP